MESNIIKESTKSYMLRTRVKQEKLELYKLHHKMVWKEVEEGLREAGVVLLTIYAPKDGGDDKNMLNMYIKMAAGKELGVQTGKDSQYW
mgnify:CR=1 FL=1